MSRRETRRSPPERDRPGSAPCNECPFRYGSLPGWLGPYQFPVQFVHDAFTEPGMVCHMSRHDGGMSPVETCAGSLHCANKSAKVYIGKLRKEQQVIAHDTESANGCMNAHEFIRYHGAPWMRDYRASSLQH